jgi:PIN domain nuclease of toxin-antitoxin system
MSAVIDTSVMMCVLLGEPGRDRALEAMHGASMSSVNVAEVVAKCLERAVAENLVSLLLSSSEIGIVDFVAEDAVLAGQLWARAQKGKFSFGDRACIATAIRLGATAVTADRIWATLDLPCPVELVR